MYKNIWLALVEIEAKNGEIFHDLLDHEEELEEQYIGAWGNVLVNCERINQVPDIIEKGLNEKGMTVLFIDKIENMESLIEAEQVVKQVIGEADWLLNSNYTFMISDKLFPYTERI
ncbi:hypothetical protein I6I98_17520 [Sphingobacterium multivorum]|jgi:hypothetical protein|uniref:Uncharacterized protein n=1 Tax=Sphingobacterium multivorum TaxID=28454 RepID=A0ABX7CL50_SPHMU|nr:hypothetical protein [Sphingobacterium multivorum]QQT52060.1 hypothetical protein I6I98_17520 [Sphingobacterium multivorum]